MKRPNPALVRTVRLQLPAAQLMRWGSFSGRSSTLRAACTLRLNRRTLHGAVRAENAAVASLRLEKFAAACAFVEVHARVSRHRL